LQPLPPRTFATDRIVVSTVLEAHQEVAGDAFDYNVDGDVVDLAVFGVAGHDLRTRTTTALAIHRALVRGGPAPSAAQRSEREEVRQAGHRPLQQPLLPEHLHELRAQPPRQVLRAIRRGLPRPDQRVDRPRRRATKPNTATVISTPMTSLTTTPTPPTSAISSCVG